jgi:aldose 1-epimerase
VLIAILLTNLLLFIHQVSNAEIFVAQQKYPGNLSGGLRSRILYHNLSLSCSHYLPVPPNGTQIPTGEVRPVAGTLFDFTKEKDSGTGTGPLLLHAVRGLDGDGTGRKGLDHCFVVDGAVVPVPAGDTADPQQKQQQYMYAYDAQQQYVLSTTGKWYEQVGSGCLRHVATLQDAVSGRQMTVHATQPGVQVYSANWLDNSQTEFTSEEEFTAHPNFPHLMNNGLCLETQHFPDAINQSSTNAQFPTVVLQPGELYFHQAVFSFSTV